MALSFSQDVAQRVWVVLLRRLGSVGSGGGAWVVLMECSLSHFWEEC